jgi:chorismate mutase/prephenate dehydratase
MTEEKLARLREKIRNKDNEIVALLNERARASVEIGDIKAAAGLDVYDPSQESRVYENLTVANAGPLPVGSLMTIFREIISASRALQHPVTVAFFGLEASFTHMAARSHFGSSAQFFSQNTIFHVFDEVERKKVQWGVVPVENSVEGSVNLTLDRLIMTPLKIRAEIFLRISQNLLSSAQSLKEIKAVYSHPQALAQCQGWLRQNLPDASLVEVQSTATAAQRVANDSQGAAIGSSLAAGVYGLNIFSEGIEDNPSNTTRFLVIGEGENRATGRDKTSILFATSHTPGALYNSLKPFADRQINMMKIESHPARDTLWEYLFFVDLAGHAKDEGIRECLKDLEKKTAHLKVLGSYPRGEGV